MRPVGCVFALLLALATGCVQEPAKPKNDQQAKPGGLADILPKDAVAKANEPPPKQKKRNSQSLLGRIRDKGLGAQAQNDLRQIALTYASMAGNNLRSLDELKAELRQSPKLLEGISDGSYVVNLKARKASGDIFVYESEDDGMGMVFFARADGTSESMPLAELKKLIGQP